MLIFISFVFTLGAVLALGQSLQRGDADAAEHLSLLPLDEPPPPLDALDDEPRK